jgi:hypothetical protein
MEILLIVLLLGAAAGAVVFFLRARRAEGRVAEGDAELARLRQEAVARDERLQHLSAERQLHLPADDNYIAPSLEA